MSRAIAALLAVLMAIATPLPAQQGDASGLARVTTGSFDDRRGGRMELRLSLSQGVPWRLFTLADPYRLVVDFREVDWRGTDLSALNASARVSDMREGSFQPGWSRLILGLSEPLAVTRAGMTLETASGAAELAIDLATTNETAFRESAGLPPSVTWQVAPSGPVQKAAPAPDGPLRIVLDPGHGGIDPGAQQDGVREADLMLRFALELRDVLLRAGHEVVLTREDDRFVSLEARVATAQKVQADMFISLHTDSLSGGLATGASVYTLAEDAADAASDALVERHERDDLLSGIDLTGTDDRVASVLMQIARLNNTPRSQALAGHVVAGINNALGATHKRPLQQAGFSVLKAADIPSILVELGFLSTSADLKRLQDGAWRAGMAAGIRDGIAAWAIEDEALRPLRRQ
jgi:N-acetylmuramoyl-L-alanine amidase